MAGGLRRSDAALFYLYVRSYNKRGGERQRLTLNKTKQDEELVLLLCACNPKQSDTDQRTAWLQVDSHVRLPARQTSFTAYRGTMRARRWRLRERAATDFFADGKTCRR